MEEPSTGKTMSNDPMETGISFTCKKKIKQSHKILGIEICPKPGSEENEETKLNIDEDSSINTFYLNLVLKLLSSFAMQSHSLGDFRGLFALFLLTNVR